MTTCDLERFYGEVADQLPQSETSSLTLSAATLPRTPPQLTTDQLVIRAGRHCYMSYTHVCVDALHVQAHWRTYRLLGLVFLAKVFHPESPATQIQLTNPHSDIHSLVLDYNPSENWNFLTGYEKRPHTYVYTPQDAYIPTHLLDAHVFPAALLPLFTLSNKTRVAAPGDTHTIRDIVYGTGSDYGNVLFASLLLNFGIPKDERNELTLESAYGNGGVGPGSAEMSLWLPGGNGWLDHL